MKCFKISEGGETFYWAGESKELVAEEYREAYSDFDGPPTIEELSDEEMSAITVQLENEDEEPDGKATLKEVFDDETKACVGGAFELCGSVF